MNQGLSKENYVSFRDSLKNVFKPLVTDELVALFPEWRRLASVKDNAVELHSFIVLYLVWSDNRIEAYTPQQVNTLKWTAILHDIAKRGRPEFASRDHTHPFAGGLAVLKIFHRLGFL